MVKIATIARRLVSPMLIVCFASVGHAQQTNHDILSTADKNEIVAAALRIAFGTSGLIRRTLSFENIEFVDATRMSEMGFDLVGPGQTRDREKILFPHVVFKRITSNDGVVSVVLWQTTYTFKCDCWYGPNSFCGGVPEKRTFTIEFNKETGEWIGQRVYRPLLQFEGRNKLLTKP